MSGDLLGRARERQVGALHHADAVLGADAAPARVHRAVDRVGQRGLHGEEGVIGEPLFLRHVDVDVAVAEMAEEHHAHAVEALGQRLHLAKEGGDFAGRHGHVELVGEPVAAHGLGRRLAHAPDRPRLRLGARDHGIGDQPVRQQALQPRGEGLARGLARCGFLLDHDQALVLARERDAQLRVFRLST